MVLIGAVVVSNSRVEVVELSVDVSVLIMVVLFSGVVSADVILSVDDDNVFADKSVGLTVLEERVDGVSVIVVVAGLPVVASVEDATDEGTIVQFPQNTHSPASS